LFSQRLKLAWRTKAFPTGGYNADVGLIKKMYIADNRLSADTVFAELWFCSRPPGATTSSPSELGNPTAYAIAGGFLMEATTFLPSILLL
jgi:hypothetical protein